MKKLFTFILVFLSALLFVACGHTHEFGEWVVVKEATEAEEGSKERTCECGEKQTEKIDKLAHTHAYGEWVVVKEATEAEEGSKERVCACGEKETEVIAKLEQENPVVEEKTIAEIVAAEDGEYIATGVVVGTNAQSFLIKDETGIMLVYKGSSWECDVVVGDKVKVTGATSVYGAAKQFGKEATYEKVATEEVVLGEAKELTVADCEAYASAEVIKPEYVKVVGTLAVSGKYFNLAIEGTETAVGSLTYPADQEAVKAFDGKKVEVTGFVTGFTGGKYFNILFTDVKEVEENIVNKYTVTFKGKDGSVIATVEVEEGQAATAPAAPAVDGFTFKEWDKAFDNVTSDLEVNAVYEANAPVVNKFVVVFKDKDGKEITSVEVEEGKAATAPNAPEVEGFKFTGWDKAFDNVTADLIVTAQYEKAGGCGNSASILFTSLLLLGLVLIRRKEW